MATLASSSAFAITGNRRSADRSLAIALGVSIIAHLFLLSLHFKFPETFKFPNDVPLEVVLVNSKSETKPDKPQVRAQANLDGGGNTDENRRAKSPLPALQRNQAGAEDVQRAQARVKELERQQQALLAKLEKTPEAIPLPVSQPTPPPPSVPQVEPPPAPTPEISGQQLAARAIAMAKLEAQISRQMDEYNKRPRKQFVGARAAEVRFAQYVEDWRIKVERIGNVNYPADARGRIYGSLRLTVHVRADGNIEQIEIDRSSGYPVLDRAAERIVRMSSPFAPFSADIRKDTDILVITRTWIFAPGDRLQSE